MPNGHIFCNYIMTRTIYI